MKLLKLCFVIETGTDVRLFEGLAQRFELTVVGRKLDNGVMVSQPTNVPITTIIEPSSRLKFALFIWNLIQSQKEQFDYVIVQKYGFISLAVNLAARFTKTPTAMLVCSPIEKYYFCRKQYSLPDKPFEGYELFLFSLIARINAVIGQKYIFLSQHLADVITNHGTHRPVNIISVYGVDTKLFVPPKKSKTEIKAKLNLLLIE